MRRQCPRNLLRPVDLISSFSEGLLDSSKATLDYSSLRGVFIDMTPEKGEQLIEKITSNTAFWYNDRTEAPKKDKEKHFGIYEVEKHTAMQAQLEAITHMMKQFVQNQTSQSQGTTPSSPSYTPTSTTSCLQAQSMAMVAYCTHCGGMHAS